MPTPGNRTTVKVFVTQRTPPGEGKRLSGIPLPSTTALAVLLRHQHVGQLGSDTEALNLIQTRDLFQFGVGSPVPHRVIHPVPVPSLLWADTDQILAEVSDNITANSNYLHLVLKSRHSPSTEPGRN